MLIPYHMPDDHLTCGTRRLSKEDLRRTLYPHHAQFWPEDVPEHVYFQRLSRKITWKRRRLFVLRLLFPQTLRTLLRKLSKSKAGARDAGPAIH